MAPNKKYYILISKKLALHNISWAEHKKSPMALIRADQGFRHWFTLNSGINFTGEFTWYNHRVNIYHDLLELAAEIDDVEFRTAVTGNPGHSAGETPSTSQQREHQPSGSKRSGGPTESEHPSKLKVVEQSRPQTPEKTIPKQDSPNVPVKRPANSKPDGGSAKRKLALDTGINTQAGTPTQDAQTVQGSGHQVDTPQGPELNTKGTLQGEAGNRKIQQTKGPIGKSKVKWLLIIIVSSCYLRVERMQQILLMLLTCFGKTLLLTVPNGNGKIKNI